MTTLQMWDAYDVNVDPGAHTMNAGDIGAQGHALV